MSATEPAALRHATTAARLLMGLAFLVFGLNGFLRFLPEPADAMPEGAAAFAGALAQSGYMFPLIFCTQTLVGALLLAGRFVPLALVLIAPFLLNAVLFHVFLEPSGLPVALAFAAVEGFLAWRYREAWRPLFTSR